MYYNYNDYELIYLIKEGVEEALKEMFRKYSHFLYKFYYQQENRFTSKGDFVQEGFMVLQKAIETYDMDKEISFYTYFNPFKHWVGNHLTLTGLLVSITSSTSISRI